MSYRRHTYWQDIAGPTWLYRLFASDGLAYIGVSNDPANRLVAHRRKPWWGSVTRVEFTWYESRAAAFAAEKKAIIEQRPQHNIARPKAALREMEMVR